MMMVLLNIVVRCASPDRSSSLPSHSISRGEERKQNKIRPEAIYLVFVHCLFSYRRHQRRRGGHSLCQRRFMVICQNNANREDGGEGRIFVFTRMTRRTLMMWMKMMMFVLLSYYYCHTMPAGNGGMRSLLYFYSTQEDDVNVRRIEGTIETY